MVSATCIQAFQSHLQLLQPLSAADCADKTAAPLTWYFCCCLHLPFPPLAATADSFWAVAGWCWHGVVAASFYGLPVDCEAAGSRGSEQRTERHHVCDNGRCNAGWLCLHACTGSGVVHDGAGCAACCVWLSSNGSNHTHQSSLPQVEASPTACECNMVDMWGVR